MNPITVYSTTFEFFTAPGYVQFRLRQFMARWGANLDTRSPRVVKFAAFQMLRRYGIPGTPF